MAEWTAGFAGGPMLRSPVNLLLAAAQLLGPCGCGHAWSQHGHLPICHGGGYGPGACPCRRTPQAHEADCACVLALIAEAEQAAGLRETVHG